MVDVDRMLEVTALAALIAVAIIALVGIVALVVMEPLWVLAFISGAVLLWLFAWAALTVADRRLRRHE